MKLLASLVPLYALLVLLPSEADALPTRSSYSYGSRRARLSRSGHSKRDTNQLEDGTLLGHLEQDHAAQLDANPPPQAIGGQFDDWAAAAGIPLPSPTRAAQQAATVPTAASMGGKFYKWAAAAGIPLSPSPSPAQANRQLVAEAPAPSLGGKYDEWAAAEGLPVSSQSPPAVQAATQPSTSLGDQFERWAAAAGIPLVKRAAMEQPQQDKSVHDVLSSFVNEADLDYSAAASNIDINALPTFTLTIVPTVLPSKAGVAYQIVQSPSAAASFAAENKAAYVPAVKPAAATATVAPLVRPTTPTLADPKDRLNGTQNFAASAIAEDASASKADSTPTIPSPLVPSPLIPASGSPVPSADNANKDNSPNSQASDSAKSLVTEKPVRAPLPLSEAMASASADAAKSTASN
jgi:hypothetical protein